MADRTRAVSQNAPGPFFVDATCIDCDTCRQLAPATFGEGSATSFVRTQPRSTEERRLASLAQLACPLGAIGADVAPSRETLGGLRYIFLTHRDDCAAAPRFAKHFGASRIIHRADASAQPDAELVLDGEAPVCAWRSVCWYSWPKQLESIEKLRQYEFSWIGSSSRSPAAPPSAAALCRPLRSRASRCHARARQTRTSCRCGA